MWALVLKQVVCGGGGKGDRGGEVCVWDRGDTDPVQGPLRVLQRNQRRPRPGPVVPRHAHDRPPLVATFRPCSG